MKPQTKVFARFESRGYPADTKTLEDVEVREVIRALMHWILSVTMGSRIIVTLARTLTELDSKPGKQMDPDLQEEFERLMQLEMIDDPTAQLGD